MTHDNFTDPALENSTGNIDLTQFDDDFAEAEIEDRGFEPIPDGKYQVRVEAVELTRSKTSDNPMLKWSLRVLGPTHKDRLLWRYNVLLSKENIRWLKTDLHVCGLDLEKVSDLEANLDRLLDVNLEVTQRTRGESTNIYFNKRIVMDGKDDGYKATAQEAISKF